MAIEVSPEQLASIRVLYRDVHSGLWGIPYAMRPGQSPTDLYRGRTRPVMGGGHGQTEPAHGALEGWIWLGNGSGWWGDLSAASIERIRTFLATMKPNVPGNAYEWLDVAPTARGQNPMQGHGGWKLQIKGPTEWVVWGYGPDVGQGIVEPAHLTIARASGKPIRLAFRLPERSEQQAREYRRVTGLAWRFSHDEMGPLTQWVLVDSEEAARHQAEAAIHGFQPNDQADMRTALSRVERIHDAPDGRSENPVLLYPTREHWGGTSRGVALSTLPQAELARGTRHELEHGPSVRVARRVAADHLVEDPKYYQHVEAMEREVKRQGNPSAEAAEVAEAYRLGHLPDDILEAVATGRDAAWASRRAPALPIDEALLRKVVDINGTGVFDPIKREYSDVGTPASRSAMVDAVLVRLGQAPVPTAPRRPHTPAERRAMEAEERGLVRATGRAMAEEDQQHRDARTWLEGHGYTVSKDGRSAVRVYHGSRQRSYAHIDPDGAVHTWDEPHVPGHAREESERRYTPQEIAADRLSNPIPRMPAGVSERSWASASGDTGSMMDRAHARGDVVVYWYTLGPGRKHLQMRVRGGSAQKIVHDVVSAGGTAEAHEIEWPQGTQHGFSTYLILSPGDLARPIVERAGLVQHEQALYYLSPAAAERP